MSSSTLIRPSLSVVMAQAHAAVDVATSVDLELADADDLVSGWRELERLRNRLASLEAALICTAERRGLPARLGARNVVALTRGLLRVDPRDAAARVRAATATQPQLRPSGHVAPAEFPAVAAAQADGDLSPEHARIICRVVHRLPDAVRAAHGPAIESELVGYADHLEPRLVAACGDRIRAHHDPDGVLTDAAQRHRERDLDVCQRLDGSSSVRAELTAECTEYLLTALGPLSAPTPAVAGVVKDTRTATQRRHDALLTLLQSALRAGRVPEAAGVTSTVILPPARTSGARTAAWPAPATAPSCPSPRPAAGAPATPA